MSKRLLITGARNWDNRTVMAQALKDAYFELRGPLDQIAEKVILVSGNARGADAMAEEIWTKNIDDASIERHPAKDYPHPLKRNDAMVAMGADLCLVFMKPCKKPGCIEKKNFHYSHGTVYTEAAAEGADIPTRAVYDPTDAPF